MDDGRILVKQAEVVHIPVQMILEAVQLRSYGAECNHPKLIIPEWTHTNTHGASKHPSIHCHGLDPDI